MCGYANALSFKKICEDDLNYIENFIKNDVELRLIEQCKRTNMVLTECEKVNFFGMYAASVDNFQLHRCERALLMEAVEQLKKFGTNDGKEFRKYFNPPKNYKISKNDTEMLSVGLFFSNKQREVGRAVASPDGMKPNLFLKLKPFFESFKLKPIRQISEDIIEIIELGTELRVNVICVFCAEIKKVSIQCDSRGPNYYWNFSNFRKHIKQHVKNSAPDKVESPSENSKLLDISRMPILDDSEKTLNNLALDTELDNSNVLVDQKETNIKAIMYNQFSDQNLRLADAVLTNGETKKYMVLKINDRLMNVNVIKVKGDGNCLFAALVLQLYYLKNETEEHSLKTAELRRKVVVHIRDNFDKYKQVIEGRILEEAEENGEQVTDLENQCYSFIEEDLPKAGRWGGMETIMAVSEMFGVNILTFNEKGPFCFPNGYFELSYRRTLFLAYRLGSRITGRLLNYNHYDSICGIDAELLYKCSCDLADKFAETKTGDTTL